MLIPCTTYNALVNESTADSCVAYDTADGQKPNYNQHNFRQVFCIVSHDAISINAAEKLTTDVQVEDCANSNGAEEADNERLARLFNLMDLLMHSVDDGETTKEQDQYTQWYKSVDRNNVVVHKLVPRCDCSKPYEDRDVEQHINGRLQRVIESLQAKPVAVND